MGRKQYVERVRIHTLPGKRLNGSSKVLELQADFIQEFLLGATDADACEVIGLSLTQFRRWIARGKAFDEALAAEQEDLDWTREEVYAKFYRAVRRAKAKFRASMRMSVVDAATNKVEDTKAGWLALEVLSRRDSANWGRDAGSNDRGSEYDPNESFL